jgi:hypothetical protein
VPVEVVHVGEDQRGHCDGGRICRAPAEGN